MDDPTIIELKNNECALVIDPENGGVEFYLPQYEEDEDVPYGIVLLSVMAGLLNKQDADFMEFMEKKTDEMINTLEVEDGDTPNRSI